MKQYVIDASVAAKWFVEEDYEREAGQLFEQFKKGKIKVIVPELFYMEMANIFNKRRRRKLMHYTDISRILDDLMDFPFKRYSDHELTDVALENAARLGISVYDAIYLSLSEIYVAPFITADEALLKACEGKFDFIEPLKDLVIG